jgi:hypothetical protein
VRSVEESKRLNRLRGPAIIVSASGMLTGGRVLHHLERLLPETRNKILLVGYQAVGTRGWRLQQGEREIKVHGRMVPRRAEVQSIEGFSAHGDEADLLDWLSTAPRPPQRVFLVHGEAQGLAAMRKAVRERLGWPAAFRESQGVISAEGLGLPETPAPLLRSGLSRTMVLPTRWRVAAPPAGPGRFGVEKRDICEADRMGMPRRRQSSSFAAPSRPSRRRQATRAGTWKISTTA